MADREADQLWNQFQTDPLATYQAIGNELAAAGYAVSAEDPRVAEMYDEWRAQRELSAYDTAIEQIVTDPANADIDPNRLHTFVAAADGDFNRAVELYRADIAGVLTTYGLNSASPATPQQEQTRDYLGQSPQDALHRAIEDAAAQARRR